MNKRDPEEVLSELNRQQDVLGDHLQDLLEEEIEEEE